MSFQSKLNEVPLPDAVIDLIHVVDGFPNNNKKYNSVNNHFDLQVFQFDEIFDQKCFGNQIKLQGQSLIVAHEYHYGSYDECSIVDAEVVAAVVGGGDVFP